MENLKPIDGYKNSYFAHPDGYIYSAERLVKRRDGSYQRVRGRTLKPFKHPRGYVMVSLWDKGEKKQRTVHRLIAETLLADSYFEGAEVNHIDGNKENNKVENLEWVTSSENTKHWLETLKK